VFPRLLPERGGNRRRQSIDDERLAQQRETVRVEIRQGVIAQITDTQLQTDYHGGPGAIIGARVIPRQ
jgi:hypothetical protein